MTKKDALKLIEKRTWYIQIAVGHFTTSYPWMHGFMRIGKYFKTPYQDLWLLVHNETIYECMEESQIRAVLEGLYSDPEHTKEVMKRWFPERDKFFVWCRQAASHLKDISDAELGHKFSEFLERFMEIWTAPLAADGIGVYTESELLEHFERELPSSERSAAHELFAKVCQPSFLSFMTRERISLLALALLYLRKSPAFADALSRHQCDFYWVRNNYKEIQELPESYFHEKVVEEARKGEAKIQEELARLESLSETVEKEKQDVLKRFVFSPDLLRRLRLTPILGEWLDYRKEMNLRGNHYLKLFLEEIGRRGGVRLLDMYYYLPKEAFLLLDGERVPEKEILARQSGTVFVTRVDGSESLFSGHDARELIFEFEKKRMHGGGEEDIRGVAASKGPESSYRGTVRVVRDPSTDTFLAGEILVTSNTRPEFVPMMHRALAVIIDEGGITTHAAIVSRELGKPCIIGTKVATKVLKDGDTIEVDVNTGIVKISK